MADSTMNTVTEFNPEERLSSSPTPPLYAEMLAATKSDDSSIMTLSDYSPSTWSEIVSYGVPTVGIAFLAITHPLMFLAGAGAGAGLFFGVGGAYANMSVGDCTSYCDDTPRLGKNNDPGLPHELTIATVISSCSCDDPDMLDKVIFTEPQQVDTDDSAIPSPLAFMIVDNAQFTSLHAKDFFQIFFGDDAPFSFKDFQKQRGDLNIVYSPWGDSNQRTMRFQTPTRTPFFGPSHATAIKTQVLKFTSKSCVIMENTTSLEDIPFCDRFVVCEQWVFTSTPEKICTVRVTAEVNFSKSCAFEGQIEAKSSSTLRESLSSWRDMAQKALILTEKKRFQEQELKFADEVEVSYQGERKSSCVVGEEEEDEEDWEMDPLPDPPQRKSSLQAMRKSISQVFTKNQPTIHV